MASESGAAGVDDSRGCSCAPARFSNGMARSPIEFHDERLRLTIPLVDAVSFAMGWSDLHYRDPAENLRQVIGLLAIDELQRGEQWRLAAMLQACLAHRWPAFKVE